MPSIVQTLKGIKAFVMLLLDENGNLKPVWELSDSLLDSLIVQKWEHFWEKPVVLLRAELNVQPVNSCEFALRSV